VTQLSPSRFALRRRVASVIVAAGAVLPASSAAQAIVALRPSASITELYDSNVFATPDAPRSDAITRVSPAVDAGYRTASLDLRGHYTFDAEGYSRTAALTNAMARQRADLDLRHTATPRLTWTAGAGFARTSTPTELVDQTGVLLPPARATQLSASSTVTRHLDPRTYATADYTFTEDSIDAGVSVRTHGAALNAIRQLSLRSSAGLGYRVEWFRFGPQPAVSNTSMTAHVMGLEWTHALTARTSISVAGGPRMTDNQLSPEVSARLRSGHDRMAVSLGYQRTQTAVLGIARPVGVERLSGQLEWGASRGLRLRATPAWFRSRMDLQRVDVYRIDVGIERPLAEMISIDASVGAATQSGRLHALSGDGSIDRYTSSVRLVVRPPVGQPW
jgi:hypothetical protein